jgi:hypothetical protein
METNNRSAQSILQATVSVTSNKSPSTSHSLSRRASVTSDINSINAEDASNFPNMATFFSILIQIYKTRSDKENLIFFSNCGKKNTASLSSLMFKSLVRIDRMLFTYRLEKVRKLWMLIGIKTILLYPSTTHQIMKMFLNNDLTSFSFINFVNN